MSKQDDRYVLVTWYIESGDNYEHFITDMEFITSKQLDDIKGLMKSYGVKRWVRDPHTVTKDNWKSGDGSLIEYRNVTVRPIKIVERWGYSSEKVNGR